MALQSRFRQRQESTFRATKIFTDRTEPRKVYADSIAAWEAGRKEQEILVYYGFGGIGKSKLLKELMAAPRRDTIRNIFVSLDAFEFGNPVNVLMSMRNQMTVDCGLFDHALLQYSAKAQLTPEELIRKVDSRNEQLFGILNELISLGTGSLSIPTAILQRSVNFIRDLDFKRKYRAELEELVRTLEAAAALSAQEKQNMSEAARNCYLASFTMEKLVDELEQILAAAVE